LPIWAERYGVDKVSMALEGGGSLAGDHVPQLDRVVFTPGGQRLAIRAERHGLHIEAMSLEGGSLLAGLQVPQLDRLVPTPRGQRLPIPGKHNRHDNAV